VAKRERITVWRVQGARYHMIFVSGKLSTRNFISALLRAAPATDIDQAESVCLYSCLVVLLN